MTTRLYQSLLVFLLRAKGRDCTEGTAADGEGCCRGAANDKGDISELSFADETARA